MTLRRLIRDKMARIRVTTQDLALIDRAARAQGKTRSEFIRDSARECAALALGKERSR